MKRNFSPCINVCKFTEKNNWCIACGRTLCECKKWKSMSPYDKQKLMKDLKKRLVIINKKKK